MPKISEEFASRWLKAEDLDDDELTLTIATVGIETFKETKGDMKKVSLHFRDLDKGLILNVTNRSTMVKLFGDDTDDWEGKKVTLYVTEVKFDGKMMPAIRIKSRAPKVKVKTPTVAGPAEGEGELTAGIEDDIPF